MPGTLNDLLKFYDQAGMTIDDPTTLKSARIDFRAGSVTFGGEFKPGAVPWPEGMKDCSIVWTRDEGM